MCTWSNDFGTCAGEETCNAAVGWVGCTAAEPAADPHEALEATLMGALSEGRGVIRILAEGGTAVFLDGRSLGPAPVPPQMVTAGAHTVRGLPPGGTPWEGSVTVLSKQKAMLRIP